MQDLTENHRFLHAFCVKPKMRFESQQENEEVLLVLRAHPITQLSWIFNSIILFFLLIVLNFYLPLALTVTQIVFVNIFTAVVISAYAWFNLVSWFYNVGIITNSRIIDVDFSAIIYKEVTIARMVKVEDITSKSAGYFGSLFNFGDVFIQTAGTEANIEFLKTPDPAGAVRIINDLIGK